MSGIAGVYYLDGRAVDRTDVECMVERITHRGPDASGVWSEGAVGLGHRMLWTTPESLRERLPLVNKRGDLALTADARIDNRDELVEALGLNSGHCEEMSDSELILRAYEQWGERCSERLLGDFAFVIWDRRRQLLFCARDHFGVKPFYYYDSPHAFAFASEIKALLCLREVPRRLNETRVADYLVPMLEDKAITFYQDILRLPPAHIMIVDREGIRLRPYWALDPSRELRLGSDGEYAEAFRELFTNAVRCRLRSAFPVGSMLSGGLDSSSIVCVARNLLAENGAGPLHTFSAVFDDVPECDERPFIQAVLAQGGLVPHYVPGDQLGPLADLDRVFHHEDEPFYAPNLFLHWGLYSAARKQGVRVVLDGLDGDTSVSHGLGFLPELAAAGRWKTLAAEVIGLSKRFDRSPWSILSYHAIKPLVPIAFQQAWRALRGANRATHIFGAILSPAFALRVAFDRRLEVLRGSRIRCVRTSKEGHYRGLTAGLIPYALEVADRAAAGFGVEPRYPFFDRLLVEFCLALPPEQKIRQGWTRLVMRRAMGGILPAEVQWRGGKSDLSPNFIRGLLTFHREILDGVMAEDSRLLGNFVNIVDVREACRRYLSERSEEDALTIWKVATLAWWLRRAAPARRREIQ